MKPIPTRFWLVALAFLSLGFPVRGQVQTPVDEASWATTPKWVDMMQDPHANFFDVQRAFYSYWQGRKTHRGDGYKPFKRWEYYWQFRVNPDGSFPAAGRIFSEYERFAANQPADARLKSGNAAWFELGPRNRVDLGGYVGVGRLNAIACHPSDTSIVYAGAPSGGLWRSTDGGGTWSVLTDNTPSLGVSSILIRKDNPNDILIGTGDRDHGDARGIGVLRSTDGGHNWQAWNEGMGEVTVGMMARDESNPDFILAATTWGIFKTTDGGAHWSLKLSSGNASFKDVKMKPGNSAVAYATCVNATGFFRTEDAGETWQQVSPDAGVPAIGRLVIGVTPAASNLVYLVSGDVAFVGCFVSQDDGQTFIQQSSSPNILGYASDGSDDKSQAWYDLAIFIDPINAQIVHVGGINLWRSDNGGKNWRLTGHWTGSGATTIHADQHTFFYNPVNKRLYAGNDGGIYFTDNQGTNWKEISKGLGIGQIYRLGVSATNPYKVITGFQDNGSATWMGTQWLTSGGGDGMEAAIDPTDYQYSYTTLYYGDISQLMFNSYSRQVAGQNFGGITEKGAWVTPFLIDRNDPGTMIAGYCNIWITHDLKNSSAISWKKISDNLAGSNGANVAAMEQSAAQPGLLFFSRFDRRLFRTEDVHQPNPVWIDLTPNLPASGTPSSIKCHPFDPMTVYITLGRKVFKSSDKGETWTDISGTLPAIAMNSIFFDESSVEGLYVGTDAGVYYRDAGMDDWVLYNTNLPASVEISEMEAYYDHLDRANSRLRASTFGRGLWESPLAESGPILPPTFLVAQKVDKKINLFWNAPFYPEYVTRYKIFRNGLFYDTSTSPMWSDTQVNANTDYSYFVVAEYAGPTDSDPSNSASVILADTITIPYETGFEPSTAGWTPSKQVNGWQRGTSADLGIDGNNGEFFGIRGSETTVGNRVFDCLASPAADLTTGPDSHIVLSFDYACLMDPGQGKLTVVYRISPDSSWTSLADLDPTGNTGWIWQNRSLTLPAEALSSTTQIGFLFQSQGTAAVGAGIDNISLKLSGQTLGTGEMNNALNCLTYPNPSNGSFNLDIQGAGADPIRIRVISISGQVVYEEQIAGHPGSLTRTIALNHPAAGIYQVRVESRSRLWSEKITIR